MWVNSNLLDGLSNLLTFEQKLKKNKNRLHLQTVKAVADIHDICSCRLSRNLQTIVEFQDNCRRFQDIVDLFVLVVHVVKGQHLHAAARWGLRKQ